MEKITQAFEFYTLDNVIIQNDVYSILRYHVPVSHPLCHEIQSCKLADAMHRNTSYGYVPDEHNLQLLNIIINKEIYNEDALLAHLNGPDAVTIDETMYEQIAGMFASSDADNHVLAMEIMANCKYKESLLYLEFLFKEYSDVMYSTHTKNHVNFKSLLSYLGKNHSMSTSIDTIINCLIDKGVLDVEKVNIIMNRYHSQISERGDSAFFKVKTITLHDETLALLNANYTYTIQEDFEPIEVIEEIEAVLESIETNSAEEEALALEDASFFSESELNEIDYFLIDTNCLIHPMCFKTLAENPEMTNTEKLEGKMINKVLEYISELVDYVKPKKGVFIAIDGVAPVAKIKQQRSRRFKSVHDRELYDKIRKKHNKPIPTFWNNSAITPGTLFMEKLHHKIIEWSKTQKVQVIYSSCNTPAEGEHKLLQFIRENQKEQKDFKYVLYGLDADLIFLALSTNSDKIYLLREANQMNNNDSSEALNYVSIKIMKECIAETMQIQYQENLIEPIDIKLDSNNILKATIDIGTATISNSLINCLLL
jgi:hypothetical protein